MTVDGSLEILGTGHLDAASGALVMTGAQGARLALPGGATLASLQVGDGAANRLVTAESNLAIAGPLTTMPGATLALGLNTLTSQGAVINQGALSQLKRVAAGTTRFLRITDQAGAVERYQGVDIATAAALNLTRVTVQGDQPFGAGQTGVQRCYDVRPATPGLADLTFYYLPEEATGIPAPQAWRANGQTWEGPLPGGHGSAGQALYVTATGVSSYSLFGLAASNPLAVALASFLAETQADHILVTWETVSELDNAGFNLYRSLAADGECTAAWPTCPRWRRVARAAQPTATRTRTSRPARPTGTGWRHRPERRHDAVRSGERDLPGADRGNRELAHDH